MTALLVGGYSMVQESWQWLYLIIIGLAGVLLCLPIANAFPRRTGLGITTTAALAILLWFTPLGLIMMFGLHVALMATSAPIGASAVAAIVCVCSFWLTTVNWFPFVRKTLRSM